MKNVMTSVICFLLAAVMIFGMAACAGETPSPTGTSDMSDDTSEPAKETKVNPYLITYYCGIPADQCTFERYKEAAEAGFNLISIDDGTLEQRKEVLRWCEELGVRATVRDGRISDILYSNWETRLDDPEALDETVRAICGDFRDYPALYGYDLIDEPEAGKFPLIGALVALFRKYDPDRICYINLFPNYADPETQLGTKDYKEYLTQFLEIVKPDILSLDHYHLHGKRPQETEGADITEPADVDAYLAGRKNSDHSGAYTNSSGFYQNLRTVRKLSVEYGVPYMLIVLLTEHMGYRYLTRGEISYEVWQTLAYGCSALSYFTYWSHAGWDFYNGLISDSGEKCVHYYDVQAINAAILPIGERIAQTVSQAVFHVGYENDMVDEFPEEGYAGIRALGGGKYTIGFFADGSFIIANKNYKKSALCTVETDAALEIFDVETETFVPVTEKQFDIPAGGGIYLKVAD